MNNNSVAALLLKLAFLLLGATVIGFGAGALIPLPTVIPGAVRGGPAIGGVPETLLIRLIFGSFAFTAMSYVWAWTLYTRLEKLLTNHWSHEYELLSKEVAALKVRMSREEQS